MREMSLTQNQKFDVETQLVLYEHAESEEERNQAVDRVYDLLRESNADRAGWAARQLRRAHENERSDVVGAILASISE